MLLKVIIAEDEDAIRKQIINIVSALDDYEIVYSTDSGAELLAALKKVKPDVIITDIDMPGMSGIEAIKAVRQEIPNTEIVFITAFDEFIKQAVQLYAFDFIEKPLNVNRLKETMEKIKDRLRTNEKLIEFKSEGSIVVVKLKDLYFVEAIKKKTMVYVAENQFVSNYSLKEVEEILIEDFFFKTSRSYIVNLKKIRGIQPVSRTSFQILFEGKKEVAYLTKNHYEKFRNELKKYHN